MPGAYGDPRRSSFAALLRQVTTPFIRQANLRVWLDDQLDPTRRTTGLREYQIVGLTGKGTGFRTFAVEDVETKTVAYTRKLTTGTTVWIENPNPARNPAPLPTPKPEPASTALVKDEEPEAVYDLTPIQVGALQARVTELEAEVARLREKYETPCKGLVKRYGVDNVLGYKTVHCGGFMGHPGDCAEVW